MFGFLRKGKIKGRYDRLGNTGSSAPRNTIVYLWTAIAIIVVIAATAYLYNSTQG